MASLVSVSVADLGPLGVGLKTTPMVQVSLGARTRPVVQVLPVSANWSASAPARFGGAARVTLPCWSLVNVTVCLALVEPTASSPKGRLAGAWARCPLPVPVSATKSGALMASLPRRTLAALSPDEVGLKVTSVVQDFVGASTLPAVQVVAVMANC